MSSFARLIAFAIGIPASLLLIASLQPARPPLTYEPVPEDVLTKETGDEGKDKPHFDEFSWREFIALNWPAKPGPRGVADPDREFGTRGLPVVWRTWKPLRELYPSNPIETLPPEWHSDEPWISEVQLPASLRSVNQGGLSESKRFPLIAQNRTYVRYETRINRVAYEFIREKKYYLESEITRNQAETGKPISFPVGSIIIKAAWMELTSNVDRDQYYHIDVDINEWVEGMPASRLRPATVGLVGLHIAHKTPRRPSWIWSTFEHVNNLTPARGSKSSSFSQNDPSIAHDRAGGTVEYEPPQIEEKVEANPRPVDVLRRDPISTITIEKNRQFHETMPGRNNVWRNYELVVTNWFGVPDPGDRKFLQHTEHLQRVRPRQAANITLETYNQGSSCIGCHGTAMKSQFVFFLQTRAYKQTPGSN